MKKGRSLPANAPACAMLANNSAASQGLVRSGNQNRQVAEKDMRNNSLTKTKTESFLDYWNLGIIEISISIIRNMHKTNN